MAKDAGMKYLTITAKWIKNVEAIPIILK